MRPKKLLRFVTTFPIIIAVWGLQLYGQRLDPRSALAEARTRAAQLALTKAITVAQIPTAAGDLTTFDVPGAVNGTFPQSINPAGKIAGYYYDANFNPHGFLREPNGTFTTIDIPGAVFGTQAFGINPAGKITGNYVDANFNPHGFLRASGGAVTTFDVPGPSASSTSPFGINNGGVITGTYFDASSNLFRSFVRARDGTFTTFDPGFIQNDPGIINPAGAIVGYFSATSPPLRSFVRDPKGTVTIFDAPGVCLTQNGTTATGINPAGLVVGSWSDPNCADFHGFFRAQDGTFTSFDVPGAQDTGPGPINPAGTVVGIYFDASGIHGFLRVPNGAFSKFDIPGAPNGPNPTAINPAAAVTGFYEDANGFHGFLFQPQ